jgi:hypothetical protein
MSTSTPAAPDSPAVSSRRAAMEEERDFLIRSLHDLEAEHDAGDIDDEDYESLRDDYTARAARLLRELESPEAEGAPVLEAPPAGGAQAADGSAASPVASAADSSLGPDAKRRRVRRPWARWQIGVAAAIVVIVAGLVGWQIGHNSSARQPGQTITGGNTTTGGSLSAQKFSQLLTQAESEAQANPVAAIKAYNQVLTAYPDQPQALTEEAWIYAQGGYLSQSQSLLTEEEKANPTYDPAYGYLGIVQFGLKNYSAAVTQLTFYLGHGPDPALKAQATQALAAAKVDAAATASPTTAPAKSPTTTTAG